MKATQFVVLLCAGIASAAKCKPALPSSTSSAASSVSASASASAALSSSSASVSASKSASSFGSSSSLAVSASASASSVSASSVSVSASVSASASLSSASASSASSVASSVVASSASASASAPATSATCGPASPNLLGANANFATNSGNWVFNINAGSGNLESTSCEATTNQCVEFVTTADNNPVVGIHLTTVAGSSYTVTFDFSFISGTAASDSIVCTVGGSTTVSKTLDLTATGFNAIALDFTAATTSTSFFCSGTTKGAADIAFNNFKQTINC